MNVFLDAALRFLTSRWSPVAFIITALGVIYSNFLGVMEKIAELMFAVDGIVRPAVESSGVSVSALGFLNYVMPLDLCVAYLNLYVPFLVTCATIRFIKAWIPTVS